MPARGPSHVSGQKRLKLEPPSKTSVSRMDAQRRYAALAASTVLTPLTPGNVVAGPGRAATRVATVVATGGTALGQAEPQRAGSWRGGAGHGAPRGWRRSAIARLMEQHEIKLTVHCAVDFPRGRAGAMAGGAASWPGQWNGRLARLARLAYKATRPQGACRSGVERGGARLAWSGRAAPCRVVGR